MRHVIIPSLVALCISACSASETRMTQNASPEPAAEQGASGRGLAQPNPQPRRGYEIVLTIEEAPGPFAVVRGSAQYDVANRNECGQVNASTGTVLRISDFAPVALQRVSETEYRGTVYFDALLEGDYYGRGTCHWELVHVSAMLQATGADGETTFESSLSAAEVASAATGVRYFWKQGYPRSEMDAFPDSGFDNPEKYRPELRNDLFKITMKAQGPLP